MRLPEDSTLTQVVAGLAALASSPSWYTEQVQTAVGVAGVVEVSTTLDPRSSDPEQ